MSAAHELLALPNVGIRLPWVRIAAGCLIAMLTVGVQTILFSDAPIHFAPSLVAIAMVTLYLGYKTGVATLSVSAILINYALLHPRWAWSSSNEALEATALYIVVAAVLVVTMGPLHQRLSSLERALEGARRAAATGTQLRMTAEVEFRGRLSEMQGKCEKVLDLAQSAASISRYADTVAKRLSVINAAIAELPPPKEMLEDQNGMPIIHPSSRGLIDLTCGGGRSTPLQHAIHSIVGSDGRPLDTNEHPLTRAIRGTVVYGEQVGWLSESGQVTTARLYATSAADDRLLAIAIVTDPRARIAPIED